MHHFSQVLRCRSQHLHVGRKIHPSKRSAHAIFLPSGIAPGLVQTGSLGLAGLVLGSPSSAAPPTPNPIDRGEIKGGEVQFGSIHDLKTEAPEKSPDLPLSPEKRVGFAVVALGRLTMNEILPALPKPRRPSSWRWCQARGKS